MPNPVEPQDKIQMNQDMYEVFVSRTKTLSQFSPEYQETLKAAYRFSATRYNSSEEARVNRTSDTLDII